MFNLKNHLLLTFISFSLQIDHCLITHYYCSEIKENNNTKSNETIAHCLSEDNEKNRCIKCEKDYALSSDEKQCIYFPLCLLLDEDNNCYVCSESYAASYDGKSCISFPNCIKLEKGDNKCSECKYYYHPNSEGKCIKTLCSEYDEDICIECFPGYYLTKNNTCEEISIPYCDEVSETDENECTNCLLNLAIVDKKCVIPEKLISGCSAYDENGKCATCYIDYDLIEGNCVFKGCQDNEQMEYACTDCEKGYYLEVGGACIKYGETEDEEDDIIIFNKNNYISAKNKIEYAFIIFIIALLI